MEKLVKLEVDWCLNDNKMSRMRFFETAGSFLSSDYLVIHQLKSDDSNTVTASHLICCVCALKTHDLQQKKPIFHKNVRLAVGSGVPLLPLLSCTGRLLLLTTTS